MPKVKGQNKLKSNISAYMYIWKNQYYIAMDNSGRSTNTISKINKIEHLKQFCLG